MAPNPDVSLDDLIKDNKRSSRGRGGRIRTRSRVPYPMAKRAIFKVKGVKAPMGKVEVGTRLYVSNLDYGVSDQDIKELFSEIGGLQRCGVHYDRSGRSEGTAEVIFRRRDDALAAVRRYNNVQLDGKRMKIEIVGSNIITPIAVPKVRTGTFTNPNPARVQRGVARGGPTWSARGHGRGQGRGDGPGKGRGRGRGRGKPPSAAELDADLESYHAEAMQTN